MNITDLNGGGHLKILIITGVHGDEITPIIAGFKLIKILEDNHYKHYKHLTILHAVNIDAIRDKSRSAKGDDSKDLNRMFVNESAGDIKAAIDGRIQDYDVVIDMHSSPNCTEYCLITNNEFANKYVEFCENHEIPYLLRYDNSNTIKSYSIKKGKIGFTLESNGLLTADYTSVDRLVNMVEGIIEFIDDFKVNVPEDPKYNDFTQVYTHLEGIYYPKVKLGDIVKQNDILCFIIRKDGSNQPVVYHGEQAIVIAGPDSGYVTANDILFLLQPKNKI